MFTKAILFLALLLSLLPAAESTAASPTPDITARLDSLMEQAIAGGIIAGGVVLIGNRTDVLLERVYGKTSTLPDAPPTTPDTIFDLASLTKVTATTPAILKLAEEGKLSLVDPVVKWLPEFSGRKKDDLLILHLLTHTSGLDDFPFTTTNPQRNVVSEAALVSVKGEVGSRFHYADINFILLAEIVTRVSGLSLDRFAEANFYAPLGMRDTGFCPDKTRTARCAATYSSDNSWLLGLPQDYPARQLGGVAGHAGLFSTARDLSIFCRMLLNGGMLDGKRVLSFRAVEQMTSPYFSRGGKVMRGLGWDMASPYSSPKGNGFSEFSFGHTGYSGTSVWVDPENGLFVILLTTRLEYRRPTELNALRGGVSSLVAEMYAPVSISGKLLCASAPCPPDPR